jgi:hypothetical protein
MALIIFSPGLPVYLHFVMGEVFNDTENRYAEFRVFLCYTDYHYAEYLYAKCLGAIGGFWQHRHWGNCC